MNAGDINITIKTLKKRFFTVDGWSLKYTIQTHFQFQISKQIPYKTEAKISMEIFCRIEANAQL